MASDGATLESRESLAQLRSDGGCFGRIGGLFISKAADRSGTDFDYLQAGERLRELLAPLKTKGLKDVFVATDVAAIADLGQHSPAVHVVYQGERGAEGTQSGRVPAA